MKDDFFLDEIPLQDDDGIELQNVGSSATSSTQTTPLERLTKAVDTDSYEEVVESLKLIANGNKDIKVINQFERAMNNHKLKAWRGFLDSSIYKVKSLFSFFGDPFQDDDTSIRYIANELIVESSRKVYETRNPDLLRLLLAFSIMNRKTFNIEHKIDCRDARSCLFSAIGFTTYDDDYYGKDYKEYDIDIVEIDRNHSEGKRHYCQATGQKLGESITRHVRYYSDSPLYDVLVTSFENNKYGCDDLFRVAHAAKLLALSSSALPTDLHDRVKEYYKAHPIALKSNYSSRFKFKESETLTLNVGTGPFAWSL